MTIGGGPYAGQDLDDEAALTADVSVVPVIAPSSSGIEIAVPFQIDLATGGVAFISDYYTIIRQHVLTILMTSLGERVMMPTYGSDAQLHVFAPIGEAGDVLFANNLQKAVQQWEPAIRVTNVSTKPDPTNAGALIVEVDYTVQPLTDLNQVTVSVGGTVQQVVSP